LATLLGMARLIFAALPQMVLSGWAALLLAVAVVLVYLQYRRLAVTEAEIHGYAKHSPLEQTLHSLVVGTLVGVAGSLVLSTAGVGLVEIPGTASALLYLWPISIILGMLNARFFCFAYGATLLALCHLVFGWPSVDVASLVGLVAVLHMVEAVLIWVSGPSCATPMSVAGRDGDAIPGFTLQRFWPVPLVLPVFAPGLSVPMDMPGWWPLVTAGVGGWQLLPVVVTMGYSDLAITAPPQQRARQSSQMLLVYSGVLLGLAVLAGHYPALLWAAALFSGVGHEAMAVWSGRVQLTGLPYLRRPNRGVGVLDVMPGSTGSAAGLRSGSVILSVDDYEVHSREQLHEVLLSSPAWVRIMYRNGRQLDQSRLPRPEEGLFGLGVITLPEPGDQAVAKVKRPAFFRWSGLEK